MSGARPMWGLVARFEDAEALIDAARRARPRYHGLEAYSPFPVDGLADALDFRPSGVPRFALAGGTLAALSALAVQYYAAVIDYPINVGGRPTDSWPAFIPAIFILGLLGTGLAAALGMLILNRLPRLYHPVFDAAGFDEASRSGFFLALRADDHDFDTEAARAFLREAGAIAIEAVML